MAFNCTGCGLCCKKMSYILNKPAPYPFLIKPTQDFPYGVKEDGSCEKLDENDRCTVYDNRPLLCSIDRLAEKAKLSMSKFEWYQKNYVGCNDLQMEIR